MADIKISELPAAISINSADSLVIVQSGITKKASQSMILAEINAETLAINGLIDNTNTIVSGHTATLASQAATISGHTATIGSHTTSIGTINTNITNLGIEDVAINNVLDDVIATVATLPTSSIYTASGNLFNTGIGTTKLFSFNTDLNGVYNPNGYAFNLNFGSNANTATGALTTAIGGFSFVGRDTGNSYIVGNYTPTSATFQISGYNGTYYNGISISNWSTFISGGNVNGTYQIGFGAFGIQLTDNRTTKKGLEYAGNYVTDIIANDRSVPDVGAVKTLRQQTNTWTTGTRPTAVTGVFGFNTTTSKFEGYNGTIWVDFA